MHISRLRLASLPLQAGRQIGALCLRELDRQMIIYSMHFFVDS